MTDDPAPTLAPPRNGAAYKYVLLWLVSIASMIAGAILLSTDTVTILASTGNPDESSASFVSVSPWGRPLLEGGAALAVILLLLDVYVGPRFHR